MASETSAEIRSRQLSIQNDLKELERLIPNVDSLSVQRVSGGKVCTVVFASYNDGEVTVRPSFEITVPN